MSTITPEMEQAITRQISRDRQPLRWRRVRHVASDREGYIERAYGETYGWTDQTTSPPAAEVVWDDAPKQYGGWRRSEKVELAELELLDPPVIQAPVRIRKVLFRGHKEQVAERWRQLGSTPEGCERYIEFDPQPMAYRRWRIVHIGPFLSADAVAEIPDQFPHAALLRRMAKDNNGVPDDLVGG